MNSGWSYVGSKARVAGQGKIAGMSMTCFCMDKPEWYQNSISPQVQNRDT
jgi:hypothetical protein